MRVLILSNIRSAENVGSMLRSADAFGVDCVCLVGYTPSPIDRYGRPMGKLIKASLGAEKSVRWEKHKDMAGCIAELREQDKSIHLIALEQDERSVPLKKVRPPASWALIVGNEVEGVEATALNMADKIVEIPMQGSKESLNVAVAAGIALNHLSA